MKINLRKTINKSKLKAKFESEAQGNQGNSDFLPYFKLKNKDSMIIRFLSDANPDNQDSFTYIEEVFNFNGKNMKFDGLTKDCPSSKLSAELFSEVKALGEETPEGNEVREKALKFYKKRKYLANVYIVDAPEYFWTEAGLDPDKIEDRIKVVSLPKKVYEIIKDTVMDEDYDDLEFYNFGDNVVNFKLTVKKNPRGFNDYSASKFELRPKKLEISDEDIDKMAEHLKNLSEIFKVYSKEEFDEAIEIELSGEEEEAAPKKKITKKVVSDDVEDDEDDDEEEEEIIPNKKATKKVVPDDVEEDDDDDEEEEEAAPKKDIKSLRSGILNKLKINDD